MTGEYVCDSCGGTFETDWSDEEAGVEFHDNASPETWDAGEVQMAIVCDDCYQLMAPPEGWPVSRGE